MADLEFINISKAFNGVYALKDASFECNRGEVHALLGENGAGKSTLLKVLSGAYKADSGKINIFGETVQINSPKDAMELGIGTVYQELTTIPDLSVSENIFIGRIPRKKSGMFDKKKLNQMTNELFEKYDVDDIDGNMRAGDLSLSKRQMIEILRVLSKQPEIVIFDEATSALTENRVKWLLGLARKLANSGKIVIFISHRMAEIQDGCDRITVLRNGKTVGTMRVDEVEINKVISMMLGRSMSEYFPEKVSYVRDEIMLEVKGLQMEHLLNGVDFTLNRGEVLGVGGLAGQGQTELLNVLYGAAKAKGSIRLNGNIINLKSPKSALNRGIALVPEDRGNQGAVLSLPISFNISLPSLKKIVKGIFLNQKKERVIVDKYMAQLKIKAESSDKKVMNLSGGNQQKVVLAKMLATEPALLLMHDITRGVDVGTKKEMFILVRKLAEQGNSIIFFSTDIEELANVCDRVLVMYDGKVGADLKEEMFTKENIIAASIGADVSVGSV